MDDEMRDQEFETSEVIAALGIKKEQLSHWIHNKRMIEPLYKGMGRGGRNKYSFENLLDLALIQGFTNLGLDINVINKLLVFQKKYEPWKNKDGEEISIWEYINSNRRYHDKRGFYLLFGPYISGLVVLDLRKKEIIKKIYDSESCIIINVMKMLSNMEKQIDSLRK